MQWRCNFMLSSHTGEERWIRNCGWIASSVPSLWRINDIIRGVLMRRRILISALALLGLLAGVTASQANYLGNIQISYDSPSYLPFGRYVEVTYDYNVTEAAGARIWVFPFTDGNPTDNVHFSGFPRRCSWR